jgi:hypothetical protein
VISDVEDQAI